MVVVGKIQIKKGGHLFASVLHPCFDGNHDTGIGRQGVGIDRQVVVKNYFEPKEWEAPLWQGTIPVIWRHRTIQDSVVSLLGTEKIKIQININYLKRIMALQLTSDLMKEMRDVI